jgi:hypothetical protein
MEALIFLMGQTIGVPPPPENSEGTIGSHSEILSAIESRVRARGLWHKAQLQVSRALYCIHGLSLRHPLKRMTNYE